MTVAPKPANNKQGMPQQNIPFLNPDGTISTVWYLFLLSLYNRTGGPTGVAGA